MTVGAVSGTDSYTSFYQAQFFSDTVTNDRLNSLMKEYGVQVTGNEYNDLQSLYQAMYSYFSQYGVPSAPNSTQQAANAPWAAIMRQVGLSATGNLNNDYTAFTNKINALQGAQAGAAGKNGSVQGLQQSASLAFAQPNQGAQLSGADIVAQINRAFLVGK